MAANGTPPVRPLRPLRPVAKTLPEDARANNRALVLQTVLHYGRISRADIAREIGLTRVTVSDHVAQLLESGLLREAGHREPGRPGKPAMLIELDSDARHVLALDLSDHALLRAAIHRLDGSVVERVAERLEGRKGTDALGVVVDLLTRLAALSDRPVLGIGVGSPGLVEDGTIRSAPNLDWHDLPLQQLLSDHFALPVVVVNDADAAALAEHAQSDGSGDTMVVTIGHGVGAGLVLGGTQLRGSRSSAGEIGHVTVGTDGGPTCACGREACLEAWVAAPRLEAALAEADDDDARTTVLETAGRRLGIALAPVVGALDLGEVVLNGPADLVDTTLASAMATTIAERTMPTHAGPAVVRVSALGPDIVLRGAAAGVVSHQLGVS